ncbi:MATE family efflux transporter [Schaalia sp. ZJ1691]|uniref:MATE family efflux transporter n=1 Tax=Schaalia sp. ZJ1691 TaxID=2709404 RepID=UPI0013EAE3EF|nr:MATE family efflux transporter [Schaalia sp. ZJ1691]
MDNTDQSPQDPQPVLQSSPEEALEPRRSVNRQILALALPSLGALVAEPLFTVIDSAMVGHLGTVELAGLGLASTVLQTIVGLFVFLLFSTTTMASQALGAGKVDRAFQSGVHALWLAGSLGIALMLVLTLGAEPILSVLGASEQTLPHATAYLRWSAPGLIGMLIVYAATGTLRGLQNTMTPLIVASLGALFNVGANAFFIYGLRMGVAGSGAGTALTQTLMALWLGFIVISGAHKHSVSWAPSLSGVWGTARQGTPLFLRTIALRLALLANLTVAAHISVTALASHQVVWTVWTFAAFVLDAIAVAAQSLIGYAIGAHDTEGIRPLMRSLLTWALGAGLVLGAVFLVLSPILPYAFGTDPHLHELTTRILLIAGAFMPIAALAYVIEGALFGADKGGSLAVACIISLALYAPMLWAQYGAFSADSSTDAIALSVLWLTYSGGYMGLRALTYAYLTWWSPRAVVPRARPRQ